MKVKKVLAIICSLIVIVFVLQNSGSISINFLFWRFGSVPKILFAIFPFLLGFFLSSIVQLRIKK